MKTKTKKERGKYNEGLVGKLVGSKNFQGNIPKIYKQKQFLMCLVEYFKQNAKLGYPSG